MRNLTAIRVLIKMKLDGSGALYPDFNSLASVQASGKDWSKYVDTEGIGWHYDLTSTLKEETAGSPFGQQFGVLCVPDVFAVEAIAAFPGEVVKITETQLQNFYDKKAHIREPDEHFDHDTLNALRQVRAMKAQRSEDLTKIDARITKAMDPNDREPGIRKNRSRRWADRKIMDGVTINP